MENCFNDFGSLRFTSNYCFIFSYWLISANRKMEFEFIFMNNREEVVAKAIKDEFLSYSLVGLFIFFTIALLTTLVSTAFFIVSVAGVFIAVIYKVIEQKEEMATKNKYNSKGQSTNNLFKIILNALLSSFSIWALIIFAIIAFFVYYSPDALVFWRYTVFILIGTVSLGYSFERNWDVRWGSFGVAFLITLFIYWLFFYYGGTNLEKCINDYQPYGVQAVFDHCDMK